MIEQLFIKTVAGEVVGPFDNTASAKAEIMTTGGVVFYKVVPL